MIWIIICGELLAVTGTILESWALRERIKIVRRRKEYTYHNGNAVLYRFCQEALYIVWGEINKLII